MLLVRNVAAAAAVFFTVWVAGAGCGSPSTPPVDRATGNDAATAAFQRLAATYLTEYAASHPVSATQWGIHDHDGAVNDLSRAGIQARVSQVKAALAGLEAIEPSSLGKDLALDHRLLDHALRAELLQLEEIRMWQHNPMIYNGLIARSMATLVDRVFAPLDQRVDSLISRLDAIPGVIVAARENVRDVPPLWARLAVKSTRGTVSFMRTDLIAALDAQGMAGVDPQRAAAFRAAHQRALTEVEGFAAWLESEVLPGAKGEYRLGRDRLARLLRYAEHVDVPIDELRDRNEAAIREYKAWVERTAAEIDPGKPPAEVMAAITGEFPPSDQLLDTARGYMNDSLALIRSREIVTLPSDTVPVVRPTPKYQRTGFASMSSPGPFEKVAKEAYYNITTVDPEWDEAKARQHLTYFNYPGLLGVTVHEAFPGHYLHALYRDQITSDLRKVIVSNTLSEGWAHYTEQMMVDEGIGESDPRVRMGQLRRALQRHARWYAALALHAYDEPLDEVIERFQEIAYFAAFPAQRESERGTYNATYLSYAFGRMEIFRLRDDYREQLEAAGQEFSMRDFHDRFLRLGLPPTLAREAMLSAP